MNHLLLSLISTEVRLSPRTSFLRRVSTCTLSTGSSTRRTALDCRSSRGKGERTRKRGKREEKKVQRLNVNDACIIFSCRVDYKLQAVRAKLLCVPLCREGRIPQTRCSPTHARQGRLTR